MGHFVTVYDLRFYPERHPNLTVIQGDFLQNNLPDESYDVAIMVSTLEHIGRGEYGDTKQPDADFAVLKQLRRILREVKAKLSSQFPLMRKIEIPPEVNDGIRHK